MWASKSDAELFVSVGDTVTVEADGDEAASFPARVQIVLSDWLRVLPVSPPDQPSAATQLPLWLDVDRIRVSVRKPSNNAETIEKTLIKQEDDTSNPRYVYWLTLKVVTAIVRQNNIAAVD